MVPVIPGARIVFDALFHKILLDQWESEKLEPSLRMLVIVSAMIYQEQGAMKLLVKKLIGNTESDLKSTSSAHVYGCAADISIVELIDPRITDKNLYLNHRFPRAQFVCDRLNTLFPFGDGPKMACVYNMDHIHLECPPGGFKKSTQALSDWQNSGSVGTIRMPQRERRAV